MKYLTPKQVKARTRGQKSALRVTIQHWKQNARLKKDEFDNSGERITSSEFCGLCQFYKKGPVHSGGCDGCPFILRTGHTCCWLDSPYNAANAAFDDKNHPAFIAASKELVELLERFLQEIKK